jgi:hypothetical protein
VGFKEQKKVFLPLYKPSLASFYNGTAHLKKLNNCWNPITSGALNTLGKEHYPQGTAQYS